MQIRPCKLESSLANSSNTLPDGMWLMGGGRLRRVSGRFARRQFVYSSFFKPKRWNTLEKTVTAHEGSMLNYNKPLPSSKNPHFQNEVRCTTFLICMRMKNDFHIKGSAPTLVLKQRPGETRKWPIISLIRMFTLL